MTASTQVYRGLSCGEDVLVFVAVLQQLRSELNEACGTVEMFAFLDPSLLMVEKLKTSFMCALYDLTRSLYAQASVMHLLGHISPLVGRT